MMRLQTVLVERSVAEPAYYFHFDLQYPLPSTVQQQVLYNCVKLALMLIRTIGKIIFFATEASFLEKQDVL